MQFAACPSEGGVKSYEGGPTGAGDSRISLNVASHRHIKTSKGWIDIAFAPHVCARPPQTPTNNDSQPKTTATTATPSNPNIIIYNTDPNVAPDDPNDWYQLGSGEFGDHPGNI